MPSTDATVSCPGCSRAFKWKPEYAGRKAKCKCGATVQFPKDPPAAPPPERDTPQAPGEYDLHDPAKPTARNASHKPVSAPKASSRRSSAGNVCIDCGKPLPPGAVLCTACGMNQKTGRRLDTAIDKLPMALAAELKKAPVKTSGGVGKWIGIAGAAAVLGAGAYVVMYVYPGFAVEPAPAKPLPRPSSVPSASSIPAPSSEPAVASSEPTAAPVPAASNPAASEVPDPPPG